MKVRILDKPKRLLYAIGDFVESHNTPGSGGRFVIKFQAAINKLAVPNVSYSLCHHPKLAELNYSCTHFNDWVIAFKINQNRELIVYEIIHASILA